MQRLKLAAALAVGLFATGSALAASQIVSGFDSNTLTPPEDESNESASVAVDLGFTVNFFGKTYTGLTINENGNVTFGGAMNHPIPFDLVENYYRYPIIAPFFSDVSKTPITYGTGTYDGKAAFAVNWIDAKPYLGTATNSFQLLLVDRDNGDFDIVFNYGQMNWDSVTYDDESTYSARVGYANGGYPNIAYELPASNSSARALTDQRLTFEVRAVPEPETYAMLLLGLGIVTAMARRRKNG